jgi:hypothetical protein
MCVCALAASVAASGLGQMPTLAEHATIAYSSSTPTDAIARLQQKIDVGEVKLAFEPGRGYLKSVLDALEIPASSHQASVHNLMTSAGYAARSGRGDAKTSAEHLVRAMLFVKAAKLDAPLKGTSAFATDFVKTGPRDGKGRSLRELDLQTRVFRYPLSYLIYSDSFDALPGAIKDHVYRRLFEVLKESAQSA